MKTTQELDVLKTRQVGQVDLFDDDIKNQFKTEQENTTQEIGAIKTRSDTQRIETKDVGIQSSYLQPVSGNIALT